jgi:hypothetical protein
MNEQATVHDAQLAELRAIRKALRDILTLVIVAIIGAGLLGVLWLSEFLSG